MQNFDQQEQELAPEVDDLPDSSELAGILPQHQGNYSGKKELDKEQTPQTVQASRDGDNFLQSGWGHHNDDKSLFDTQNFLDYSLTGVNHEKMTLRGKMEVYETTEVRIVFGASTFSNVVEMNLLAHSC